MASEVRSMAAEVMPRCAQHVAAVRGSLKAAAVRSIAAEGQHGCQGDAAVRSEGPPRCAAWLPRCCRGARQGCLGDANVRNMAAAVRGSKAWLPRCAASLPR